jgi:hypothetical protein
MAWWRDGDQADRLAVDRLKLGTADAVTTVCVDWLEIFVLLNAMR